MPQKRRTLGDIKENPLPGDTVELDESVDGGGYVMLRVIAVAEDKLWCKEYGLGHKVVTVGSWRTRLSAARSAYVLQAALTGE